MQITKFRAWDKETSKMYEDDNIITTFNGELEEVYVRRNNTVDELIEGVLIISVSHSVVNQCLKLFFRIVFFPTIRSPSNFTPQRSDHNGVITFTPNSTDF